MAVFLRKLEYYDGVLFLTTDLAHQFDDAILNLMSTSNNSCMAELYCIQGSEIWADQQTFVRPSTTIMFTWADKRF